MLRVTLLGVGGSGGVPLLGGPEGHGDWGDCDPDEPRNRRSRSSAVVENGSGRRLLLDAGPDLRGQLLATGLADLEAVVFSHGHADHIMGVDELRIVNRLRGGSIDAFGTCQTLSELKTRFDYAFRPPAPPTFFRPALTPRAVAPGETVAMAGMPVRLFRQDHRVMETLGFRIGQFAYSTDVVTLPDDSLEALEGLDTWVVGCLQRNYHPVHANIDRVVEWVARLRPRRCVLTHMSGDLDWAWMCANLPPGIEPGHDGMVLDVPER